MINVDQLKLLKDLELLQKIQLGHTIFCDFCKEAIDLSSEFRYSVMEDNTNHYTLLITCQFCIITGLRCVECSTIDSDGSVRYIVHLNAALCKSCFESVKKG